MNSSLSLLIVEPDTRVAEGACLALESEGYRVVTVQRHGQARMLFNAMPNLAVLVAHCDHHDEEDESGFLDWAMAQRRNLAIIALCTHETDDLALPDGCIRLAKPFDRDHLLQAVAQARIGAFNRTNEQGSPGLSAA